MKKQSTTILPKIKKELKNQYGNIEFEVSSKKIELIDLFAINDNDNGNIHMLSINGNQTINKEKVIYIADDEGNIIYNYNYKSENNFRFLFEIIESIPTYKINNIIIVKINSYIINGSEKNLAKVINLKFDKLGIHTKINADVLLNIFNVDIEWYWELEKHTKQNQLANELYNIISTKLTLFVQKAKQILKILENKETFYKIQNISLKKEKQNSILSIKSNNYKISFVIVEGKAIITDFSGILSGINSMLDDKIKFLESGNNI